MSPKRFSQHIANLCPVPARAALAALGLFVGLAALVSLLLLLSPGAAPVVAAPPVEEPQAAAASPAPALAGPAEGTDLPSAEAAPAVSLLLLANNTKTTIEYDDPDPSVVGQGVKVGFRVDSDPYAGVTAYGWVTVTNGINPPCGRHCLSTDSYCPSNWTAWWWSCYITPLSATIQTITATFTPQFPVTYTGSSDTDSHTVNKADTNTALASGPPGAKTCDTIVLTATVTVKSPGSGMPTGTVTFFEGDVLLGTATLSSSGKATYTISSLSGGQHFFTASYSGDDNYNPSDSTALTIKPASLTPSVGLSASPPSPQTFGTAITLTAIITGATCVTPTGHVYFNDNGVIIGTGAVTTTNRTATLVVPLLSGGSHVLKAVYESDNDTYLDSESPSQTYVINRRGTTTTLSSSAQPSSVWGQPVTFSALVTSTIGITPTGQVIFFADGIFLATEALNGSGAALHTTAALEVGNHSITATYESDINFAASTGTLLPDPPGQTVNKANTTTRIVDAVRSPSVYGESVTFTAVVTPTSPGAGTPTGKVVFKVDGTAVFTGTLGFTNPGEARWGTTPGDSTELDTDPADGNHTITVFYSGDGNFNSSDNSASPFTQRVNKANTTVQLQIPLDETEFGQDVRMSAHVSADAPGAGMPTGTVTFTVNTTPQKVITGTLPEGGTSVTVVTNTIPVGTWNVQAQYSGDKHFNGDTSDTVEHKVNKTDSETTLESSANPSDYGQTVTFTATVEAAGLGLNAPISPTGTVAFKDGGTAIPGCESVPLASPATCTKNDLSAGEHEITAEYSGDGNFETSDDSLRQTVNRNATTTALTSSPAGTSVIGQEVTFTATVGAATGTPTGDVTFYDGVKVLDTKPLDASGVAVYKTSSLTAGTHPIKAGYNGTPNFSPSSSERLYHTVTAVGSTTTLTRSPDSSTVYGQSVDFIATVTGSGGTPTGQVTFKDGAATIGTETLVGGVATLTKSDLSVGTHPITVVYGGDANFGGSTSNTVNHQVGKANTTTTITSDDPDSSVVGQLVVVNFTVVASGAGSGTPTGNVTVSDGTASCVGTVAAGTCTLIPTTAGAKTLIATYAGDSNFNTSSDTESHQVNAANTTTTVTSDPNPSLPGQNVTITANVTANPPGAGTPTGQVQFKSNGSDIGGPVALVGGSASVNTSFGSEGAYNITADYTNADGNFNNSSGSTTHNVSATPADLSVTKTDSPDPVNVGDDLTYVIVVTNHGTVSTDVTLTDTLPSQVTFVSATPSQGNCSGTSTVTCNLGTVDGGGSATVTIVVNVPLTTPAGTVLRNTAQVKGTRPEPVPDPHPNTTTQETTVYRSPRLGDCNGDDAVSLADVWSIVRDIFDPTFQGTSGCDANKDSRVDAGDVPSTVLIMLGNQGIRKLGNREIPDSLITDSLITEPGPALTMPDQVSAAPGGKATVPVSFAANGHSITSLAFSMDYDETWLALDPADRDGNGVPDAVIFNLPGDFTASVTFDEGDADGEVDVFIGDIAPPLTSLSDGPIAFVILNVASSPGRMQGAVLFSLDPVASFGDTSGQSVPGTATPTGRYQHQIYLPMVVH